MNEHRCECLRDLIESPVVLFLVIVESCSPRGGDIGCKNVTFGQI